MDKNNLYYDGLTQTFFFLIFFFAPGYQWLSSKNLDQYYVVEQMLPSPCFLLRQTFYENVIAPNFQTCCHQRRYAPWKLETVAANYSFIVPDLSRCFKAPPSTATAKGNLRDASLLKSLFAHPRATNLKLPGVMKADDKRQALLHHLIPRNYEKYLPKQISKSNLVTVQIDHDQQTCTIGKESLPSKGFNGGNSKVIFFEQAYKQDWKHLQEIAQCFGIEALLEITKSTAKPFGIYKYTFRLAFSSFFFFL